MSKRKGSTTNYWVFRMNNGEEEGIDCEEDAEEYKVENEEIIEATFEFATKAAMMKHIATTKKLKLQNTTPVKPSLGNSPPSNSVLSPEDRSKLDKIAAMVEQSRPSNKIEVLIRTNSRATKAIILVLWKNIHGQHQWFCKPDALTVAISSFVTEFKQEDKLVQESLLAFDVVRRRDPSKGSDDILVTTWESKDKTVVHEYPQYIAYATVTIPHENIDTDENEQNWLLAFGERFGKAVKDIMQFPVFQDCYKDTLRNPNMWDTMTGNGKRGTGLTFVQYVADCKVKSMMCENLNTYVVHRDAKLLTTILFESRAVARKYAREDDSNENSRKSVEGNNTAVEHDSQQNMMHVMNSTTMESDTDKHLENEAVAHESDRDDSSDCEGTADDVICTRQRTRKAT
jgi:hypothetical protein